MPLPIYLEGTEDSSEQDKFKILLHPSTVCTSDLLRLRRPPLFIIDRRRLPRTSLRLFAGLEQLKYYQIVSLQGPEEGCRDSWVSRPFQASNNHSDCKEPSPRQAQEPWYTFPWSRINIRSTSTISNPGTNQGLISLSYWMLKLGFTSTRIKKTKLYYPICTRSR